MRNGGTSNTNGNGNGDIAAKMDRLTSVEREFRRRVAEYGVDHNDEVLHFQFNHMDSILT